MSEAQIMILYLEFDRYADPNWTSAEYLIKYGLFIAKSVLAAQGAKVG